MVERDNSKNRKIKQYFRWKFVVSFRTCHTIVGEKCASFWRRENDDDNDVYYNWFCRQWLHLQSNHHIYRENCGGINCNGKISSIDHDWNASISVNVEHTDRWKLFCHIPINKWPSVTGPIETLLIIWLYQWIRLTGWLCVREWMCVWIENY